MSVPLNTEVILRETTKYGRRRELNAMETGPVFRVVMLRLSGE